MMRSLTFIVLALLVAQSLTSGTNHIINGDFQDNKCTKSYCTWNMKNFKSENLPGWSPEPEIELGKGKVYNKNLGNAKVLELATSKNTCVKQVIPELEKGSYELTFGYAARKDRALIDCEFEIFFQG